MAQAKRIEAVTVTRTWYARRQAAIGQANVLTTQKQQQHNAVRDPLGGQLWRLENAVTKELVDSEGVPLEVNSQGYPV